MAFFGLKGIVNCKGGHPIGAYDFGDRIMVINTASNVRVKHDDGRLGSWDKKVCCRRGRRRNKII